MTKQFNVNDTVKYTSPCKGGGTVVGKVQKVNTEQFNYGHGEKETGYFIKWADGDSGWITGGNLSLEATNNPLVSEAKELKAELESKILELIQEFNKKTNLEVQDIELDYYQALGGECFYQVNVKVKL